MTRDPKNLLSFPKMVVDLVWTMIYFTLTEQLTFLIAASATALGLLVGWEWGVASYVFGYTLLRATGSWVNAFGDMTTFIGRTIASLSYKEGLPTNDYPTSQSSSTEVRS